MTCPRRCYEVGGPWISYDPDCPEHGEEARAADRARVAEPIPTPPPEILATFRDLQIAGEVRFDAVIRIRGTRRTWSARIRSADKVTGWPSIDEEVYDAATPGEALFGALARFDAAWNARREHGPQTCPRCASVARGGVLSAVLGGICVACNWRYMPPPRVPTERP